MDEKKADNRVLTKKEQINVIDEMLDIEKKNAQKLEELHDNFRDLSSNMEKCLELISKSVKGQNIDGIIDDIHFSNKKLLSKNNQDIDAKLSDIKKRVNKLYSEKEKLIKNKDKKINRGE